MGFIHNKAFLAIIILVVVIFGVYFIRNNPSGNTEQELITPTTTTPETSALTSETTTEPVTEPTLTQTTTNQVTLEELSKHDHKEDCWIAYEGKVYDITSYLPRHPGTPEKIMPFCRSATEFKNAFEKKHGTSKISLLMKVGTFIGDFDIKGTLA